MTAPRSVRYACGHLTCCDACTEELLRTAGTRYPQNMCPTCRARIVVIGRGDELAFQATFIQQPEPPPPPVEMPREAAPRNYPAGHRLLIHVTETGPLGIALVSRFARDGLEIAVSVSRIEHNSPADVQGAAVGMVIEEVNGQSAVPAHATGFTRARISSLAASRPLSLRLLCVPSRSENRVGADPFPVSSEAVPRRQRSSSFRSLFRRRNSGRTP